METFDKQRLLSIIEYNLKKFRINGVEYQDNFSTDDPTGIKGLINRDTDLKAWQQKPNEIKIGLSEKRYNLYENNLMMRDFLAQTIIDVFCGNESEGKYTKSNKRLYNIKPSNGSNKENKEKPFIIKRGDNEFVISDKGIYINGEKYQESLFFRVFKAITYFINNIKAKIKGIL